MASLTHEIINISMDIMFATNLNKNKQTNKQTKVNIVELHGPCNSTMFTYGFFWVFF